MFTIWKKICLILCSFCVGFSGLLLADDAAPKKEDGAKKAEAPKGTNDAADKKNKDDPGMNGDPAASMSTTGTEITSEVDVRDIEGKAQEYHYLSLSKPNPFIPPLVSTILAKVAIPLDSSLQKFSTLDLKLVGVWTLRNGDKKAMIMTPANEGIVVHIGSSLGKRGGKITAIEDNYLVVREFSLASDGSRQYEDQKLWLEPESKLPPDPESFWLRSEKVGQPNRFGYGNKNYLNTPTYESYHEELLKRMKGRKPEEATPDEARPKILIEELLPPPPSETTKKGAPRIGPVEFPPGQAPLSGDIDRDMASGAALNALPAAGSPAPGPTESPVPANYNATPRN